MDRTKARDRARARARSGSEGDIHTHCHRHHLSITSHQVRSARGVPPTSTPISHLIAPSSGRGEPLVRIGREQATDKFRSSRGALGRRLVLRARGPGQYPFEDVVMFLSHEGRESDQHLGGGEEERRGQELKGEQSCFDSLRRERREPASGIEEGG